jgi:hypothetical protein
MESLDIDMNQETIEVTKRHEQKTSIIPEDWKENIDNIWSEDLVSANRYFSTINPEISELVELQSIKDPEVYFDELTTRWDWHNHFFEDYLEPAISEILPNNSFELTPKDIDDLKSIYETMSIVDQATLVTSAGIKKHVDHWTKIFIDKGQISEENVRLLITPPKETFQAEYTIEHLRYILAEKQRSPDVSEIKKEIISKYHIDDEKIFLGRFKKFTHFTDLPEEKIQEVISKLTIDNNLKISHFYLTIEKPKLKAIAKTVEYDNVNEHRISNQLIGISGLILRKKILDYLNQTKILLNNGRIYSNSDENILGGLENMKKYRQDYMEKIVTHYRQTGDTCSAVCLMVALNHFDKIDVNKETEDSISKKSSAEHTSGSFFSKIALQSVEKELETILIHSEDEMFKNEGQFSPEIFDALLKKYKESAEKAEKLGLKIENGVIWNSERIKKLLEDGYLVITAGKIGQILHAILITGYNKNKFIVHDPLKDKVSFMSVDQIEEFMDTKIGKWGIALRPRTKNTASLIAKLSLFKSEGEKMLGKESLDK